jgi:hypothetical protein
MRVFDMAMVSKKIAGIAVFIGNGMIIMRSMMASLIIVLGLRIEVISGASYQYPKELVIAACFGILFLLFAVAAHILSVKRGGLWRWVVIACLALLLSVNLYEVAMAQSLDGLTRPILKKYMNNGIFFVWILFNYYYWFVMRKTPVTRTTARLGAP